MKDENGYLSIVPEQAEVVLRLELGVKVIKFDEEIFRRLIVKVKVQSMVEAVFVFKTAIELGFDSL